MDGRCTRYPRLRFELRIVTLSFFFTLISSSLTALCLTYTMIFCCLGNQGNQVIIAMHCLDKGGEIPVIDVNGCRRSWTHQPARSNIKLRTEFLVISILIFRIIAAKKEIITDFVVILISFFSVEIKNYFCRFWFCQ